jgi:hypothetical protein
MFESPVLVEMMARDRSADLQRHGRKMTVHRRASDRRHVVDAARIGTGWFLVDLGLRLTVPRNTI